MVWARPARIIPDIVVSDVDSEFEPHYQGNINVADNDLGIHHAMPFSSSLIHKYAG